MSNFRVDKQIANLAEMVSSTFKVAGQRGKKSVDIAGNSIHFCTSQGNKRENNQDHVAVFRISPTKNNSNEIVIAAVADGMGGTSEGKRAAQLTLSCFCATLAYAAESSLTLRAIEKAAVDTNSYVYNVLKGKGGSTLVAAIFKGNNTFLVNVGDSRAYSLCSSEIEQLTSDDTMPQAENETRYVEDWNNFNLKDNRILQHMGLDGKISPQVNKLPNPRNDQYLLLSTDGAHYIGLEMLQAIVRNCKSYDEIPMRLVSVSEWLSGHDNSTVLLCPQTLDTGSADWFEYINVGIETILKSSSVSTSIPKENNFNKVKVYPKKKAKESEKEVVKKEFNLNLIDAMEESNENSK